MSIFVQERESAIVNLDNAVREVIDEFENRFVIKKFSNEEEMNVDQQEQKQPDIFENQMSQEISEEKEQEMFDNLDSEEDFEIPAFLRKQKD